MRQLVALDLGGTHCRLGKFAIESGSEPQLVAFNVIETMRISSFRALMEWVEKNTVQTGFDYVECIVIAVPGAIENGTFSQLVNIPWNVNLAEAGVLADRAHLLLLNDFVAQGLATGTVAGREAADVLDGDVSLGVAVAVVGVGTGFGKATVIYPTRGRPMILPSEGGQASFAAETEEEFDFIRFMCARLGQHYLIWDKVLSGGGLSSLHAFITGIDLDPETIMAQSSVNSATVELFARLLGRACRNYVLETWAVGGLFLTGGVLQRNPSIVKHSAFRQAFHDGFGRHKALLTRTPVRLMKDPHAGLRGAAFAGAIALDGPETR